MQVGHDLGQPSAPPRPATRRFCARAIARRAPNQERGWTANRSESSITPTSSPALVDDRGVTDAALEHLEQHLAAKPCRSTTENAGFVITLATGALSGTPAATIRVRMSRSVTIPKPPPRRSTIAALAP